MVLVCVFMCAWGCLVPRVKTHNICTNRRIRMRFLSGGPRVVWNVCCFAYLPSDGGGGGGGGVGDGTVRPFPRALRYVVVVVVVCEEGLFRNRSLAARNWLESVHIHARVRA